MPDATLTPRQRQTANGRTKFLEKFPDTETRSAHFRDLAQRAAAGRVVLSSSDASVLAKAYDVLARIAERTQRAEDGAP